MIDGEAYVEGSSQGPFATVKELLRGDDVGCTEHSCRRTYICLPLSGGAALHVLQLLLLRSHVGHTQVGKRQACSFLFIACCSAAQGKLLLGCNATNATVLNDGHIIIKLQV